MRELLRTPRRGSRNFNRIGNHVRSPEPRHPLKRPHRIPKVSRAEVLVPHRHPGIFVADDGHDGPLRDAGHGEGARGVVPQVVEGQVGEADRPDVAGEHPREHLGVTLREHRGVGVEAIVPLSPTVLREIGRAAVLAAGQGGAAGGLSVTVNYQGTRPQDSG